MPARRSAVPTGRQEAKEGQSVDPLARKRLGLSPFQYCQNNPLSRFDPDGMIDWPLRGTQAMNKRDAPGGG